MVFDKRANAGRSIFRLRFVFPAVLGVAITLFLPRLPLLLERLKELRWRHQCANWSLSPTAVVYDESPAGMRNLLSEPDYIRDHRRRLGGVSAAMLMPECYVAAWKDVALAGGLLDSDNSAIIFMRRLRTSSGVLRQVIILASPNYFGPDLPGSLSYVVIDESGSDGRGRVIRVENGDPSERGHGEPMLVFAGQVDSRYPNSGFVIHVQVGKEDRYLYGRLSDDGDGLTFGDMEQKIR